MSNRYLFGATVIAVMASFTVISPARAADDAFCKDYARAAVSQYETATKHGRCEGFLRNADRWHADWRAHYDWCRGVNRDKAWFERNERKRALEGCTRR